MIVCLNREVFLEGFTERIIRGFNLLIQNLIDFKLDKGTGYMYCYSPSHTLANKAGKVFEHTYVMCKYLGRFLTKEECVHHIDRDKTNNKLDNLQLMTQSEHALLHKIEDGGYVRDNRFCSNCGDEFNCSSNSLKRFCSLTCSSKNREVFSISKEELYKYVWSMPTTKVAEILKVSDKAIEKRCKKYGIEKPPRGYWAKISKKQQTT